MEIRRSYERPQWDFLRLVRLHLYLHWIRPLYAIWPLVLLLTIFFSFSTALFFITTWKLFINRETDQNIHKFLGRSLWPSKRTRNDKVIPIMLNGRRWISLQHRFNVIEHYCADMNLLPPEMTNEFLHWFNYAPLPRPHSNVNRVG